MCFSEVKEGITIEFKHITLAEKSLFDSYFRQRRYENAHLNFTNLFMWRKAYAIEWTIEDGYLCFRAAWEGEHFVLPPFGPENDAAMAGVLNKMKQHFDENGWPFLLHGIEKSMMEILERVKPGFFDFVSDRDNFDYVYNAADLIELKGRKFHGKKNHANAFRKQYPDYQYVPLTTDVVDQCIRVAIEWCEKNCVSGHDETLECEKKSIIEALNHYQELGFAGGAILINGRAEAFTYGEQINEDTAVIHVEKANSEFRGLYPVICQEFCRYNWQNLNYINREEDMGLEGLRKAKESYNPVMMIEKYVATVKD